LLKKVKMKSQTKFLILLFVSLLIDQLTKFIFTNKNIKLFWIFEIKYSTNPGLVFGLFANNLFFTIFLPFVIAGILVYLFFKDQIHWLGTCLIVSGLIGNIIDRIFFGYVRDFLFVKIIPEYNISLFNFADSFLVIGVILLLISLFKFDTFLKIQKPSKL